MFENECLMNKKLMKEYVYNFLCKNILIAGYLIVIIGIIHYILRQDNSMLVIAFIVLITTIATPIGTTKRLMETSKKLNNGKIEKTYIKFSDNIIMDEGKAHLEFEYNQIEKVLQTKNFIILKTGKETAIIVLKDGFVKGNKEEFLEFINNKINKEE